MAVYDFDGETYKKYSRHQKEWGNSLISQLSLYGDERILDLGCGDGILSKQLSELVPDGMVVGLDASNGMIQTAKKLEGDNLSFVLMDIDDMAYTDEFDIIYSNAALHWVLDHSLLLGHSFHALRQGGRIYWNFAGNGTCAAFSDVICKIMKKPFYAPYFHNFVWPWFMPTKEQYKMLIEPLGFKKFELIEENKDRYFADAEEMAGWINQPTIVPFIKCIPDEIKETFRQEVIQAMIDKTKQRDGTCFETFRRLNVTAFK